MPTSPYTRIITPSLTVLVGLDDVDNEELISRVADRMEKVLNQTQLASEKSPSLFPQQVVLLGATAPSGE